MARLDRRNFTLSTSSDLAAKRYGGRVDRPLGTRPGVGEALHEDTLLAASMRSGEAAKTRALLHRRPSARDMRRHGMLAAA